MPDLTQQDDRQIRPGGLATELGLYVIESSGDKSNVGQNDRGRSDGDFAC